MFTGFRKIAIHGVPRSGTSWIGEIVNSSPNTVYSYQPLFSYAHKGYLNTNSSKNDIDVFFNRIACCNDVFTNQQERRLCGDFPIFKKDKITHIAYKEVRYINILHNLMSKDEELLLCAVIRNPLAVINSWIKAPREFRRDLGWKEEEEWRYALKKNLNRSEEYHGYEKWKDAADIFIELKQFYPDKVYIIEYKNLLNDAFRETQLLFQFLDLKITDQTVDFLKKSSILHKKDQYAVFKIKNSDDDWKKELDQEICSKIIDDLKGTKFECFLL